ncbi:hypothetical protein WMY93_024171 [Mugilogobius chulae]|uniref:Uncharacterized protein n=1 Tax=Mugilogobius chulae TaxID=88201 RepID=A0AAW0MYU3_9GOBI
MFSSLEQYQFLYDMLEAFFPVQNGEKSGSTSSDQPEAPASSTEEPTEESAGEDTSTSPWSLWRWIFSRHRSTAHAPCGKIRSPSG